MLKITLDIPMRGGDIEGSYLFQAEKWEAIRSRLEAVDPAQEVYLGEIPGKHSCVILSVEEFLDNITVKEFLPQEGFLGGNADFLGMLSDELADEGEEILPL